MNAKLCDKAHNDWVRSEFVHNYDPSSVLTIQAAWKTLHQWMPSASYESWKTWPLIELGFARRPLLTTTKPAEWSERRTPGQSGWLGAAAVFDPRSRSFSLSSTFRFSSLSSTSIFISSRCSFSCHSLLCLAPVRPGCLFRLFLSPLSPSS